MLARTNFEHSYASPRAHPFAHVCELVCVACMPVAHCTLAHCLSLQPQVASSVPGGVPTIVSAIYPPIMEDKQFRMGLRDATRACHLVSSVTNPNRTDECSMGSMHGSGEHLRRDGFVDCYPAANRLSRKRKSGTRDDLASARALAKKVLQVWEGELNLVSMCHACCPKSALPCDTRRSPLSLEAPSRGSSSG